MLDSRASTLPGSTPARASRTKVDEAARRAELRAALTAAARSLPHQGPLANFVALNQLMLYQHMPFHEALAEVHERAGAEGYLKESEYRAHFARGRIDESDLAVALRLRRDVDARSVDTSGVSDDVALAVKLTAEEVDSIALRYPIYRETPETLAWQTSEKGLRRRFREDVSPSLRASMTAKSAAWVRELVSRVGVDLTFGELVDTLLGYATDPPPRRVSRIALPWRRKKTPGELVARLCVPSERRETYLALVDERTNEPNDEARVAYLEREFARAHRALSATLEVAPRIDELEALLATDPERIATATLHAHCSAISLPTEVHPHDDSPLLARVGRDRTLSDLLATVTGDHPSDRIDPVMIRWSMSFLDQGSAEWALPSRKEGFLAAIRSLVRSKNEPTDWRRAAKRELTTTFADADAETVLLASLDDLGVRPENYQSYLERTLLELPGWAGLFHRLEHQPSDRPTGAPPVVLAEYVAVRLVLARHAMHEVARRHLGWTGPLRGITKYVRLKHGAHVEPPDRAESDAAHTLFQVTQLAGLVAPDVARLGMTERLFVVRRLERFGETERRRVWHEAYENHVNQQMLGAIAQNLARPRAKHVHERPRFQLAFCMDDREESFRRYLEEGSSDVETWAVAGFFGVAVRYRALDDLECSSLCPIVVDPKHEIAEVAEAGHEDAFSIRRRRREAWAKLVTRIHRGSRTLPAGPLVTAALGPLSLVPFAGRILAPARTHRTRTALEARAFPVPHTTLTTTRDGDAQAASDVMQGFTTEEEIVRVHTTLENMGLVHAFGRLVVLLGHGSNSVNNPHLSAYDCGACGGRHGGPNARAFAHMANRAEVRAGLAARGIRVPDDAHFLGGEHDTCSDTVVLYDLENVPATHLGDLDELRRLLDRVSMLSAQERCRRFDSAPRDPSPEAALAHVRSRAVNLAEPRPELGHQGNLLCVIGRREITQGLFLDRRAFLISYDPTIDPEGTILERILLAAGPVGAGINLQYYFALVDDQRLGSGTKLPHNLAGLLGVMDGTLGDIKIGLPLQGVEAHEACRLLLVCEGKVEHLEAIYARQPSIEELVGNEWLHLVVVDPDTRAMHRFVAGEGFVPWVGTTAPLPHARTSSDYARGKGSDYLPPAFVGFTDAERHPDAYERLDDAV